MMQFITYGVVKCPSAVIFYNQHLWNAYLPIRLYVQNLIFRIKIFMEIIDFCSIFWYSSVMWWI